MCVAENLTPLNRDGITYCAHGKALAMQLRSTSAAASALGHTRRGKKRSELSSVRKIMCAKSCGSLPHRWFWSRMQLIIHAAHRTPHRTLAFGARNVCLVGETPTGIEGTRGSMGFSFNPPADGEQ